MRSSKRNKDEVAAPGQQVERPQQEQVERQPEQNLSPLGPVDPTTGEFRG